jgi:hypothetical protein
MKTLEEVKEYFKNAKEVRCLVDGQVYDFNTDEMFIYDGEFWTRGLGVDVLFPIKLRNEVGQFAEIISYKQKTSKMKTLEEVKEHFKDAKEVRSLECGTVVNLNNITHRGMHHYGRNVWFDLLDTKSADYCQLYDCKNNQFAEIISYKDEYPKVMLVWDEYEGRAVKRVVIKKTSLRYVAWNAITIEESKETLSICAWKYAKDLPIITEVTMSEVAEAMGIEESLLIIKK